MPARLNAIHPVSSCFEAEAAPHGPCAEKAKGHWWDTESLIRQVLGDLRLSAILLSLSFALSCMVVGLEVFSWCTPHPIDVPTQRDNEGNEERGDFAAHGGDYQQAWLNDILARPVFSPGRQASAGGSLGVPRLTGIIVAGPRRMALFAASSRVPLVVVEPGGNFGDYEVQSITGRGVTVTGPRGTLFLTPTFEPVPPPAPPELPAPLQRVPPGLLMTQ